jgi:hypothetical protein
LTPGKANRAITTNARAKRAISPHLLLSASVVYTANAIQVSTQLPRLDTTATCVVLRQEWYYLAQPEIIIIPESYLMASRLLPGDYQANASKTWSQAFGYLWLTRINLFICIEDTIDPDVRCPIEQTRRVMNGYSSDL